MFLHGVVFRKCDIRWRGCWFKPEPAIPNCGGFTAVPKTLAKAGQKSVVSTLCLCSMKSKRTSPSGVVLEHKATNNTNIIRVMGKMPFWIMTSQNELKSIILRWYSIMGRETARDLKNTCKMYSYFGRLYRQFFLGPGRYTYYYLWKGETITPHNGSHIYIITIGSQNIVYK